MASKKTADEYPKHIEREKVPPLVRKEVLHEAAFRCANPRCPGMLTFNVHHIYYVSEGGTNDPDNLIALCGQCHDLHHAGHIPGESIRAWKMLLLYLNENFDRRGLEILRTLEMMGVQVSGDGVLQCAPLVAAKLVSAMEVGLPPNGMLIFYRLSLTDKGRRFVEAWKAGDERAAILAMRDEIAVEAALAPEVE